MPFQTSVSSNLLKRLPRTMATLVTPPDASLMGYLWSMQLQLLATQYILHSTIIGIIFYHFILLQSSLSVQLEYKLPSLLSQQSVKLIIIDSLAALFRIEFTAGQAAQRAQLLRAFGAQLRRLSNEYGAAVVCVNQVSNCQTY